jgi:hypothetical protein
MTRKTLVRSALAAVAVLYVVLHAIPHNLHAAELLSRVETVQQEALQ